MPPYRKALPQLSGTVFLTDGGLETWLVFEEGIELPCFAAFPLIASQEGREKLSRYITPYLRTAVQRGVGFILDTQTWRANTDWGARLGYSAAALADINRQLVAWAAQIRDAFATDRTAIVLNGTIGPRGDGYRADTQMSPTEAEHYHRTQIDVFADSDVDMVTAYTLTYAEEAIGIVRAAHHCDLPVAISFTVETDGRLPSRMTLPAAIEDVDNATGGGPAYYMINCAHPTHFRETITAHGPWLDRIRGVRANASMRSHAELDAADELDSGDPVDLGRQYVDLRQRMKRSSVLGGCCGTDHRHIEAICEACLPG